MDDEPDKTVIVERGGGGGTAAAIVLLFVLALVVLFFLFDGTSWFQSDAPTDIKATVDVNTPGN